MTHYIPILLTLITTYSKMAKWSERLYLER